MYCVTQPFRTPVAYVKRIYYTTCHIDVGVNECLFIGECHDPKPLKTTCIIIHMLMISNTCTSLWLNRTDSLLQYMYIFHQHFVHFDLTSKITDAWYNSFRLLEIWRPHNEQCDIQMQCCWEIIVRSLKTFYMFRAMQTPIWSLLDIPFSEKSPIYRWLKNENLRDL